MSVVNTQTKFLRPRYPDLRAWMADSNNVYIGRKHAVFVTDPRGGKKARFPPHSSIFANPYKVSDDLSECDVMKLYETHIRLKLMLYPDMVHDLLSLKDKNIGCTDPTHAGVLLKLIDEIESGDAVASRCKRSNRCSSRTR